jgi:hypothetical protein
MRKKRDITSLLGQMCPPAASSVSFGKLGPIVPSSVWRVIGTCELPVVTIGRAHLVMVNSASGLDRGRRALCGREGTGQRQWRGRLRGKGAFRSFSGLTCKGALVAAMVTVLFGHVGIVDGTVVPKVGVPLWQDAVGVVAVDVWSQTPATPMPHLHAVEAEPFCCGIRTHHVTWTTPLDDNCRRAVDGT